jgi:hypothetical protein
VLSLYANRCLLLFASGAVCIALALLAATMYYGKPPVWIAAYHPEGESDCDGRLAAGSSLRDTQRFPVSFQSSDMKHVGT